MIKTKQPTEIMAWSKSHRTGKTEVDKKRKNYGKTEYRIKTNEFNCLSCGDGGGNQSTKNFIKEETKIRRLTPLECERLQGYDDNYTKYGKDKDGNIIEISDTQRYRMMGNAVSEIIPKIIGERLFKKK